ncbi:Signal recognition particle receptor subunit beta [Aphelenchoides bicaudatus]|nr:Signal recognition particle receptor subunit beta [Aphelenchoides bicaudatus]
MGAKSKYIIVQLKSLVSGSTRVWVRERATEKFSGIFFDPAVGKEVKFEEHDIIKGKTELSNRVKKILLNCEILILVMDESGANKGAQANHAKAGSAFQSQPINFNIYIVIGAVLLGLLIIVAIFYKRKSKTNILLLGLSDAGKTLIFTKFISKSGEWDFYKSMKENVAEILSPSGEPLKLVDFPGAERLRSNLFENWLGKDLSALRQIIFVIDSETVSKKTRDVAELLYDVLVAIRSSGTPLLIVCNKQDLDMAKSSKAIRSLLEKELSLVCRTRNATLESTSDTQKNVILAKDGDFKWDSQPKTVDFLDCTATG